MSPVHPLDPGDMGRAQHLFIGRLLAVWKREWPPVELTKAVADEVKRYPDVHDVVSYRQAYRRWLQVAAATYLRLFVPPASDSFVGAEVDAHGIPLDLLWTREDGSLWADE